MSIIAKDNSENFEPMPLGTQQAVCAFVEDIGTQEGSYMGNPIRNRQIIICWELAALMKEGDNAGRPFMISKFYTLSLNEKANLCKHLESWRGQGFTADEKDGFDVERLIGVNCLLNIIEATKANGDKFAKVASISPLLEGMAKMAIVNKTPPEWIQKQREKSIEWNEQHEANGIHDDIAPNQDGLPF